MGFWRGVGYFISILFVIGGLIMIPFTYGASLVSTILGFIFIWMLKRSAAQERMEKNLKEMKDMYKERNLRENDTKDLDKYKED